MYGEQEFFADAPHEDERFQETLAGAGGRQLQRLAGVTVLLAAVSAVGGLVALTSLPSVAGGRRRGGTRFVADTDSQRSVSQRPRRVQPRGYRAARSLARPGAATLTSGAPLAGARPAGSRPTSTRPSSAHLSLLKAVGERRGSQTEVAYTRGAAPEDVEGAASVAKVPSGAAVLPQPSGQVEFGFER